MILTVHDVMIPTVVKVNGAVISKVLTVDTLSGVVTFQKKGPDGNSIRTPDDGFVIDEMKGQVTLEFPVPE